MKNQATIFQIALALATVAVVMFLLAQPAIAYHGRMSSRHGPSLGQSGNFANQPNIGGSGGMNKAPAMSRNNAPTNGGKDTIKTNWKCFYRCHGTRCKNSKTNDCQANANLCWQLCSSP